MGAGRARTVRGGCSRTARRGAGVVVVDAVSGLLRRRRVGARLGRAKGLAGQDP